MMTLRASVVSTTLLLAAPVWAQTTAMGPPSPTFGIRAFGEAGQHALRSTDSFEAILGEATKDIPDAAAGFRLLFSAQSFPGYTVKLERVRPEWGGTWYRCAELNIEGWLCPALFLYYSEAPPCLYAKAEGL